MLSQFYSFDGSLGWQADEENETKPDISGETKVDNQINIKVVGPVSTQLDHSARGMGFAATPCRTITQFLCSCP